MNNLENIKKIKGFSLLELVVSLAIFGILLAILSNLIIINMRVVLRNRARTRVREETGIALKLLKKDIRNAESLDPGTCTSSNCTLTINDGSGSCDIQWSRVVSGDDEYIQRVPTGGSCSTTNIYRTPSDIQIKDVEYTAYVFDSGENKMGSVIINIEATTHGISREGFPALVTKTVIASTRNFDPDKL